MADRQLAASGEPTGQRPLRPAELLCRLLDCLALKSAEQDREPVVFGQAVQFLVQQGLQITPLVLLGGFGFGHLRHLLFSPPPLRRHAFRFQGGAEGDSVQPVGDPLPRPDGRCFACENQKGRLKGVLGIVVAVDDTAAHAEDHRAVATDEGFKGRFVLLLNKGRQQLPIPPACAILPQHRPAKMPDHRVHLRRRHTCPPCRSHPASTIHCPVGVSFIHFFLPPSQPTADR
jgi:hypothetical protein